MIITPKPFQLLVNKIIDNESIVLETQVTEALNTQKRIIPTQILRLPKPCTWQQSCQEVRQSGAAVNNEKVTNTLHTNTKVIRTAGEASNVHVAMTCTTPMAPTTSFMIVEVNTKIGGKNENGIGAPEGVSIFN